MYAIMGKYKEQDYDISMGNIYVGGKCFPILRYHCITKVHRKLDNTMYDNNAPDIIGGFDLVFRV